MLHMNTHTFTAQQYDLNYSKYYLLEFYLLA